MQMSSISFVWCMHARVISCECECVRGEGDAVHTPCACANCNIIFSYILITANVFLINFMHSFSFLPSSFGYEMRKCHDAVGMAIIRECSKINQNIRHWHACRIVNVASNWYLRASFVNLVGSMSPCCSIVPIYFRWLSVRVFLPGNWWPI